MERREHQERGGQEDGDECQTDQTERTYLLGKGRLRACGLGVGLFHLLWFCWFRLFFGFRFLFSVLTLLILICFQDEWNCVMV